LGDLLGLRAVSRREREDREQPIAFELEEHLEGSDPADRIRRAGQVVQRGRPRLIHHRFNPSGLADM
jgi:hypothetical protein